MPVPLRHLASRLLLVIAALCLGAGVAHGQIFKKLKETAKQAAESETLSRLDELIRNKIRCVFDDLECIRGAGDQVVLTTDDGEVIVNDAGEPVSDPDEAGEIVAQQDDEANLPGRGAWANYDFVPGERVLFDENYALDNVGDFPRRLELVRGNWEIVEWEGRLLLRNTGPRGSDVKVVLPEDLPERFTIELEIYLPQDNWLLAIYPSDPGQSYGRYPQNYFQVGQRGTGVAGPKDGVTALSRETAFKAGLTSVRIMVDGRYAKVFVGERRVANVPNGTFKRGSEIHFINTYAANDKDPLYVGSIRIAAGGRDLYDALEESGRVATRGIYFASGSARIRPESTPTLQEIAGMLRDHPELSLLIEGHTDSDGEEAFNLDLSSRRAAAVRELLIAEYGITEERLNTEGFGESRPAEPNDTPEGKQQNRRVELVRLGS